MVSRHFFRHFSALLVLTALGEAVDFTCPTGNITDGAGTFPREELNVQQFPANYYCPINFQIADGFVVKLTIAADVKNAADSLTVTDAMGKIMVYSDGVSLFFAPAKNATVTIASKSGTSQFWFRYEFVSVRYLENVKLSTGSALKLALDVRKTYTFTSQTDHVVLNLASAQRMDDPWLLMIYVYDGLDVTAPYIGTLYEVMNSMQTPMSKGSSFTLMNLYGMASFSWLLANDYSAISSYSTYQFFVYNNNVDFSRKLTNLAGSAAFTFLCDDCTESYLTELTLANRRIDGEKVEFSPLTPSHNQKALLTYKASDATVFYMPQQIPGTMFTMVSSVSEASVKLTSSSPILWKFPFDGRKGTIFSPSLWQPGQGTSAYNHTFESAYTMTFSFNLQSVIMSTANEKLLVRIGSSSGTAAPFDTVFTNSVASPGVRVANGTFMTATYTGDFTQSSSIITFEMKGQPGTVETTTKAAGTMETTTRAAGTASYTLIFFTMLYTFLMI